MREGGSGCIVAVAVVVVTGESVGLSSGGGDTGTAGASFFRVPPELAPSPMSSL